LGKILNSPKRKFIFGKICKTPKDRFLFLGNPSNTNNKTLILGKCHKPKKALISPKMTPKIKLKLGEKCQTWGLLFAVLHNGLTTLSMDNNSQSMILFSYSNH
jgi:hypothetical protein